MTKKFQMITEIEIQRLIFAYVDLILKCENSLREKFNIDGIPYAHQKITSKTGELNINATPLEYNFHGSACTIVFGSIELNYDVYLDRENYIVTSPWKFMRFINSYRQQTTEINESIVTEYLQTLSRSGMISKVYKNYLVYEINFNWYVSFKETQTLI